MKRITLITFLCSITISITAQNFQFLSNLVYSVSINDAVELNNKFYLVGSIDSSGTDKPYFCIIDSRGVMIFDSVYNSTGEFINVHEVDNILYISHYFFNRLINFHMIFNLQYDTNFVFQDGIFVGEGVLQKSKMNNDSTILYIGYEPPLGPNHTYSSFVVKQDIITEHLTYNFQSYSINPLKSYDILSNPNGYYLFTNSPDSSVSNQVSIYNLDDSLNVVNSASITTSYKQFISNSPFLGPVTAVSLSDSTFMLNGHFKRPRYANQTNANDIGLIVLDSSLSELNLDYAGKIDTNSFSGMNSIANLNGAFYLGNTENINGKSEFMVSKADSTGNILWTKYYIKSNASIRLNKILPTSDQHLFLVGSYQLPTGVKQAFAIKTDTNLNSLPTLIKEIEMQLDFKVYPNPFKNELTIVLPFSLKDAKYTIFTIDGRIIKHSKIFSKEQLLDVSSLSSGIYFIKFKIGDLAFNRKIIKL